MPYFLLFFIPECLSTNQNPIFGGRQKGGRHTHVLSCCCVKTIFRNGQQLISPNIESSADCLVAVRMSGFPCVRTAVILWVPLLARKGCKLQGGELTTFCILSPRKPKSFPVCGVCCGAPNRADRAVSTVSSRRPPALFGGLVLR